MFGQLAFWSVIAGLVGMGILLERIIRSRAGAVVEPRVVINWRQAFADHRAAPDDLEAPFQGGGAAYVSTEEARIVPFPR